MVRLVAILALAAAASVSLVGNPQAIKPGSGGSSEARLFVATHASAAATRAVGSPRITLPPFERVGATIEGATAPATSATPQPNHEGDPFPVALVVPILAAAAGLAVVATRLTHGRRRRPQA